MVLSLALPTRQWTIWVKSEGRLDAAKVDLSGPDPKDIKTLRTLPNALGLLALVNLLTLMLFGLDKIRAEDGTWRVSEGTLLTWAFFGGTIGADAGRAVFRHKTRKQPFSSHLHQTAILQVFAAALAGGWMLASTL